MIAGIEIRIIALQAMIEFGNRNGREANRIAVRRTTANEEYATNLYTFMSASSLHQNYCGFLFAWLVAQLRFKK